jgi:hypothetical protein
VKLDLRTPAPLPENPHAPRGVKRDSALESDMSDRLLFSLGGASMIIAFIALAMLWPI